MRSPALPLCLLGVTLSLLVGCRTPTPDRDTPPAAPASTDSTTPPAAGIPAALARYRQAAGLNQRAVPVRLRASGVGLIDGVGGNRRIVIQAEHPGRYRQFDGPGSSESQLRMTVFMVNGPDAWRVGSAPLAGRGQSSNAEERRAAEAAAARQNQINAMAGIMPIWLLEDPAVTVVDIGPMADGPFAGAPALALKFGTTDPTRLVFDAETGLPSAAIVPFLPEIRSTGGTYTMRYEDYREVEGLRLPFRIVRDGNDRSRTRWMFRTWEVDPTFTPTTFERTTPAGR
jgi:hypothetical protein